MVAEAKSPARLVAELVEANPELRALQVGHLNEDLVNLMVQETPKEAIKIRPGRGGNYPYIPLYWAVPFLNALFGYLWDVVVLDKGIVEEDVEIEDEIIPEGLSLPEIGKLRIQHKLEKVKSSIKIQTQVWVWGCLVINFPGKTTSDKEYFEDGCTIKREVITKIDPVTIKKHAFGGVDIKYYSDKSDNAGMKIDLADDFKAAEADMLKKAGSYLGLWADVYGERESLQERGPSEGQLRALYKRGETKGLSRDKIIELCQKAKGQKPEDLDPQQYLDFMRELLGAVRVVDSPSKVEDLNKVGVKS